jgi:hypothetical protein
LPALPEVLPALNEYRATQAQVERSVAMPYVTELATRFGFDLGKVRAALLPEPIPLKAEELPDEGLELGGAHISVGSALHTTADWSYVRGDSIRIHQLLPIRAADGSQLYIVLYSLCSPDEILFQRTMGEWRTALFSAPEELLATEVFYTRIPHSAPGTWLSFQTSLRLKNGQPIATIAYLHAAPPLKTSPDVRPAQRREEFEVSFVLGKSCLTLVETTLVHDEF